MRAIYSQYPVLLYRDAEGKWRDHICDFCVEMDDNDLFAIAVKHARKTQVMNDLLDRIRAEGFLRKNRNGTTTRGAVSDIRLMTEREATYGAYENAERILRARCMRDDLEFSVTVDLVQTFHGRFRFGDLLRGCHDRAARRTAILLLIDEGILVPETLDRIDDLTMLMVSR